MKKFISLMIVAVMVLTSVAAFAEPVATQHTIKNNVYIEGKVGTFVEGKTLLLTITKGDNVLYINNYDTVKPDGTYTIKFKHQGDLEGAAINVKYEGEDVTSSVVNATTTAAIMEADVYVTDKSDRSFDQNIDTSFPEYTFDESSTTLNDTTYTLNEHKYQADYEVPAREGLKAVVDVKNKYGYEEDFVVMVTAYDKNNKMLDCKVQKFTADYAENGEKITYDTVEIDVPEGTVSAKAFCWSGTASLIPYGKEADGTLPKVDVFCVGDSTGDTWDRRWYPQAGWGTYLQDYLNEEYAKVYYDGNGETYCTSGAWAQSILNNPDDARYGNKFYGGGNWDRMEANDLYSEGDYVIVCLGINDQSKGDKAGIYSSLKWYEMGIEEMVARTKAKGTNLILCSAMPNAGTTLAGGRATFNAATKAIADKYGIPYIDFSAEMMKEYAMLGTDDAVLQTYYLDRTTFLKSEDDGGFGLNADEIANHGNEEIRGTYVSAGADGIEGTSDDVYQYTDANGTTGTTDGKDETHPNIRGVNLACQKIVECLKNSNSNLRFYVK